MRRRVAALPPLGAPRGGVASSGGGIGAPGDGSIASWVEAHLESTEIGGRTVYDLTTSTTATTEG